MAGTSESPEGPRDAGDRQRTGYTAGMLTAVLIIVVALIGFGMYSSITRTAADASPSMPSVDVNTTSK